MKDNLKRVITSLDMLSRMKKSGILNPSTGRILLSANKKSDMSIEMEKLETAIAISQMFSSPFNKPDNSVDGPIRFALSENKQPVGLFPHECHFLISGFTGVGKSVLLKIFSTQALLMNKENENVK